MLRHPKSVSFSLALVCGIAVCGAGTTAAHAETLSVSSLTPNPVNSQPLTAGTVYQVQVTGTYHFNANGQADAQYIFQNIAPFPGSSSPAENPALHIDGQVVDWLGSPNDTNYTAHTYSPDHIYLYSITGQGASVAFNLVDSLYSDNSGSLQVTLTATPEPGSLAMLSLGVVVMLKRRRICR